MKIFTDAGLNPGFKQASFRLAGKVYPDSAIIASTATRDFTFTHTICPCKPLSMFCNQMAELILMKFCSGMDELK